MNIKNSFINSFKYKLVFWGFFGMRTETINNLYEIDKQNINLKSY